MPALPRPHLGWGRLYILLVFVFFYVSYLKIMISFSFLFLKVFHIPDNRYTYSSLLKLLQLFENTVLRYVAKVTKIELIIPFVS